MMCWWCMSVIFDILEPSAFQKYSTCMVFINFVFVFVFGFVFVYLHVWHPMTLPQSSLYPGLSKNISHMVYSDFLLPGKNSPLEGGRGAQIPIVKLARALTYLSTPSSTIDCVTTSLTLNPSRVANPGDTILPRGIWKIVERFRNGLPRAHRPNLTWPPWPQTQWDTAEI